MGKKNRTNLRVEKGFEFCKWSMKKYSNGNAIEVYSLDHEGKQMNRVYKQMTNVSKSA